MVDSCFSVSLFIICCRYGSMNIVNLYICLNSKLIQKIVKAAVVTTTIETSGNETLSKLL